jgi:PhnB protein
MSKTVPMRPVRHGTGAAEFYRSAFAAVEPYRNESPSGEVVTQFSTESVEFWIADESLPKANFSLEAVGGSAVRIQLVVEDPDGHHWVVGTPLSSSS